MLAQWRIILVIPLTPKSILSLRLAEERLLEDDPSVLAIYDFGIWLHFLSHLEPQH